MKYVFAFLLISTKPAFSQDCSVLDNFRSYHGIKFGEVFPDSLIYYFGIDSTHKEKDGIIKYITYSFLSDVGPFMKFANLFKIGSNFEEIAFSCDKNGRVIEITLSATATLKPIKQISPSNYPIFYKNVISELKLLFGEPGISDKKYVNGSTIIYASSWQCNTMSAVTTYQYKNKEALYRVYIFDNDLKKENLINSYK